MAQTLTELTKPFTIVQNEPKDVRDKYLEGQPYSNNNFPGPFQGMSKENMNKYMDNQQDTVQNYHTIAETPLPTEALKYSEFNTGKADCPSQQGPTIPMVPKMSVNAGFMRSMHSDGVSPQVPMENNGPKGDLIEEFKDDNLSDPCNETGFGQIVPRFKSTGVPSFSGKCSAEGNPLLNMNNRPIDQFSHNNMVPFFGPKLTQNMYSTGVPQAGDNNDCQNSKAGFADVTPYRDKLQTFTGCDESYMHKRESGPLFSPAEQQDGWVYGTPSFRPNLDRFKQTIKTKNNESPVEKLQVGPGIGLDYSAPAVGGFQQYTRIVPNNISDYKSNQLEGRVTGGKWFVNHPESQFIHGVQSNKPSTYITQARRPTMKSKFYTDGPSADSARLTDYNLSTSRGKQARSDTEISAGFGQIDQPTVNGPKGPGCVSFGQAPVGKVMGSQVPMPTQDMGSFNTIRETFKRGAAGYSEKDGFWECKDRQQGSERWDLFGPARGVVPNTETREGVYMNYTDRGTINPFIINATGTAQTKDGVWNPNSFQDQQKTTRKETTNYSYTGNVKGTTNNTTLSPFNDQNFRVTRKQTTQFSHQGNPSGSTMKTYQYTYSDLPRTTRKETNQFAYQGNGAGRVPMDTNRQMYTGSFN